MMKHLRYLLLFVFFLISANCSSTFSPQKPQNIQSKANATRSAIETELPSATPIKPSLTPTPTPYATQTFTPMPTKVIRPAVRSIDLVDFQSSRNGKWFSVDLDSLSEVQQDTMNIFKIKDTAIKNRRNGQISPTIIAGYFFVQWNISAPDFEKYAQTVNALFIRSAMVSFVDYPNNQVLDWDRKSKKISTELVNIIRICNMRAIPVFLEINYTDFIPGPTGTGIDAIQRTDNIANTIQFLEKLNSQGVHIEGITFGDEIGDSSAFGKYQPTYFNSDISSRFINYSKAIKLKFPEIKIYAFDSYIGATRGQISDYWNLLSKIKRAEGKEGRTLLDGFTFRESYVYMDEKGAILDSQSIVDDTESLYRNTPVIRYDVWGNKHPITNRDYLHTIINKTTQVFERPIDIGLTEYLPSGAIKISETDTSQYSDMDFIIHYSDIVGIYAQLGLDYVSTIMFGNSTNMHKAYFDREGNLGLNYPVHQQLIQYFKGELLDLDRQVAYEDLKVKVYAARNDNEYFIMILNKNVGSNEMVRIILPGQVDLIAYLPKRSYTSLIINERKIVVSGIGN